MKSAKTVSARPVRIAVNTVNKNRHQWARIVDAKTGVTLHTGQVGYIKRVAKKRFNLEMSY